MSRFLLGQDELRRDEVEDEEAREHQQIGPEILLAMVLESIDLRRHNRHDK
jgi:hypothetical protein